MSLLVLVTLLVLLVAWGTSCSWGPGTHIQLSERLLAGMQDRLSKEQRQLIDGHREAFLYGSIAADIINFKNFGGSKNHCHNWNIKERIESEAHQDHEYAFLYGYLGHLAADVVAHNHFVPFQILYALPPKVLGHTYWEARADSRIAEDHWITIDQLRTARELHSNDQIINRAVPTKALSLGSNKFIFNHILLARSKKSWRAIMEQMKRRRPTGVIHEGLHELCMETCLENMFQVFNDAGLEQLRALDPTGHDALKESRALRVELAQLHPNRQAAGEEAKSVAEQKFGIHA